MGAGASLLRRRARRFAEAERAGLVRPPMIADTGVGVLTRVVGLDPVRVLLFGSGPLVGLGVVDRRDAVDGHLAELIHRRTGRGAVVENRVRLDLSPAEAVAALGGAGTATFQVAVWAPRFGEELQAARSGSHRAAVRRMLRDFRELSPVPLVICHLPVPDGADWRSALRRPRIVALNRVLVEEAAAAARVTTVALATYPSSDGGSLLEPGWYRDVAARLGPAVLRAAGLGEREAAVAR